MTMTKDGTHFTYHMDPGHGWLEVSLNQLADVGLSWHKFSRSSYMSTDQGGRVYLEHDIDMGTFMEAWRDRHGRYPEFTLLNANQDSFIRSLSRLPGEG